MANRAQQRTPRQRALRYVKYHREADGWNGGQKHVLRQRQQKIDHAHPRNPQSVMAMTTPMQVASVSRLAIAQRAAGIDVLL